MKERLKDAAKGLVRDVVTSHLNRPHGHTSVDPTHGQPPNGAADAPSHAAEIPGVFTSSTPIMTEATDCIVFSCSDGRFDESNRELMKSLGYKHPHFIQVPGGPSLLHSMVAVINVLPKAMEMLIGKAVDLTNVTEFVCIAHEDCGAYKAGKIRLIAEIARRFADKPIREVQIEHLEKAGRELELRLHGDVRLFYADIVEKDGHDYPQYSEIPDAGSSHSR